MLLRQKGGSSADHEVLLREDVLNAAAEAAKPLPEGSKWHDNGGKELEEILAFTTIIDAAWLLKFALREVMPERKGIVPAWQEVPAEAVVTLDDLRDTTMGVLPVAVTSYGWASRVHPDPGGDQLQGLVPVLRTMVESCTKGIRSDLSDQRPRVWGIVWDFMSLPQCGYTTGDKSKDDRTPYQLARFRKGLSSVNVWYSHWKITTLVLDMPMPAGSENSAPVEKRGWCIFERRLSSIIKTSACCLALSKLPPSGDEAFGYWLHLVTKLRGARAQVLNPDAFERYLQDGVAREKASAGTGFRFTNG